MERKRQMKKWVLLVLIVGAITIFIACYFLFIHKDKGEKTTSSPELISPSIPEEESEAYTAGKAFSHENCTGEGSVTLTNLPMNEEDFAFIIPYGLVVGGHVTPIDHEYFSPTVFNSPRDTYDVMAMADGRIIEIQNRTGPPDNGRILNEYRLVFMHTCTFYTYYDLVTSLSDEILAEFEAHKNGNNANVSIDVEAGEVIGKIGGQTLDFAVWDFEKPLDGFISPELYEQEPWKLYTADPYDYYSGELLSITTAKNLRTAQPIAGKIDYDIAGALQGNWFLEGSNGYGGSGEPYYAGHLSIAPEHIDPEGVIVSIGDFDGEARQFSIQEGATHPSEVTPETGLVKYELHDYEYKLDDGTSWDRMSLAHGIHVYPTQQSNGCMLAEVQEGEKLKMEVFPSMSCSSLSQFTGNVRWYER